MAKLIIKGSTITGIYNDSVVQALKGMGTPQIRRASHVEPTEDGRWTADLSPVTNPPLVLGPFMTRSEALAAEVEWLDAHLHEIRG